MSLFLALVICLGVWFFMIAPFIRLWKASKQWRDIYSGKNRKQQASQCNSEQQKADKKKKIDPTVGEYVEFTETSTTEQSSSSAGNIQTETESQITDVSWEDIPEK